MSLSKFTAILPLLKKCAAAATFATLLAGSATASMVVYQASDSTINFIPDSDDGTPNRPTGDMMGNTVTLAGTERYLTSLTVRAATSDLTLPDQTVSLSLYLNDGAADSGGSGILQPNTLITSATLSDVSFAQAGGVLSLTFSFPSVQVPETFTFIVDFSPGSVASKLVGLMSNNSTAQVGSSVNRMWYGTGQPGAWLSDANWAISDGAAFNLVDAVIMADADPLIPVPEGSPAILAFLGMVAVQSVRRKSRRF